MCHIFFLGEPFATLRTLLEGSAGTRSFKFGYDFLKFGYGSVRVRSFKFGYDLLEFGYASAKNF
jgi:hypothetical protein